MFIRSLKNPILLPNVYHNWENLKVYNPGAIKEGDIYHLFYRAVGGGTDDWHSVIGHATSLDGESFTTHEPALIREFGSEKRGLEDPRIVKIDDIFYMTYTAYNGVEAVLHIATSSDLISWYKHGRAIESFRFVGSGGIHTKRIDGVIHYRTTIKGEDRWSKAGGILPKKINDKYWMLFNEHRVWLAYSNDLIHWDYIHNPIIKPREGNYFDNVFVEMGPTPIEVDEGFLVLYHGIDETITYRLGFLLLDKNDPTKILYRHDKPIFEPETEYELSGLVDVMDGGMNAFIKLSKEEQKQFIKSAVDKGLMPKVTFCPGAIVDGEWLRIYYGASDTLICTAKAKISDITKLISY